MAQWTKEVVLWGGLSLTPTHLPGGQRQVDSLWPASLGEKTSDSLKDRLKAVESDRGRHLKSSSGLTCLCLFTCAHKVMCMHQGVTLSWEPRLEIKNMNCVMKQGSFQDVGS